MGEILEMPQDEDVAECEGCGELCRVEDMAETEDMVSLCPKCYQDCADAE